MRARRCSRCGLDEREPCVELKTDARGRIVCRYYVQCERRQERQLRLAAHGAGRVTTVANGDGSYTRTVRLED